MILPIERILAPTDFSRISEKTLAAAAELAQHFRARLFVLHVVPPVPLLPADPQDGLVFEIPAYQQALEESSRKRLQELVDRVVPAKVEREIRLRQGEPAQEIVRMAEEEGMQLIVIATHGLTGWQHLVFGSVAEKVVRTAQCPVLTLRGGPEE
ncbi:MAG: universal stress protein [Acidobacteriota bacterium]